MRWRTTKCTPSPPFCLIHLLSSSPPTTALLLSFRGKDAAHGLPTETEGVVDTVAKIVLGLGGGQGEDGVVDKLAADGTHKGNGVVANGDGAH